MRAAQTLPLRPNYPDNSRRFRSAKTVHCSPGQLSGQKPPWPTIPAAPIRKALSMRRAWPACVDGTDRAIHRGRLLFLKDAEHVRSPPMT